MSLTAPLHPPREIESLTALRGVAALWVVFYHVRNHFDVKLTGPLVQHGYLAVDMFFVLSGFIMYYVYAGAYQTGRFGYWDFLLKRFARLYPVHFVTLLAAVAIFLAGGLLGIMPDYADHMRQIWLHLLLLHGWGLSDSLYLNYPSWSISAEFFAYLTFPLTCALVLRLKPWPGFLAMLAVFFVFWWVIDVWLKGVLGNNFFRMTFNYSFLRILPEFLMGLATARLVLAQEGPRKRQLGLAALPVAAALMVTGLWTEHEVIFVAGVPLLIGGLYLTDHPMPRPAVYLGLISYSIYMVHGLIEMVGFTAVERVFGFPVDMVPIWLLPVFIAGVLVAAALLYHLVEVPARGAILALRRSGWRRRTPGKSMS